MGTLAEVASFMGGSTPSRAKSEYFGGGIPWVKTTDLNNGLLSETEETLTNAGLKNSSCKIVPEGAVLVAMYGGFNQIGRTGLLMKPCAINQALTAIIPNAKKMDSAFLLEWLNYRVGYWKRFAASSRKDPNITKSDVEAFPVPAIPLDVQQKIVMLITNWNSAAKRTQDLIERKKQRQKRLVNELLSRLPMRELRQFLRELSKRNKGLQNQTVLSVTNHSGFVLPEDQFDKRVASEDLGNYKIVKKGQYAFNPSRINVGSIARLDKWGTGVLSPMYTVFEIDESQVVSDFFLHWLSSHAATQRIKNSAQGSVRETVSFEDLGRIHCPIPPISAQLKVVKILNAAKDEISLLERQVDAYRKQKRGLMQKLLTGEWRVKF